MPSEKKAQSPEPAPLPFNSERFKASWEEWLTYRREKNYPSYKPVGLKKTFALLVKQSGGDEQVAIDMIDQAMAYDYRGIYPIKKDYYARANKGGAKNADGNGLGTSAQRVKKASEW